MHRKSLSTQTPLGSLWCSTWPPVTPSPWRLQRLNFDC